MKIGIANEKDLLELWGETEQSMNSTTRFL